MKVDITYKGIWKVALPIIISNLAQNIINVTDTAFVGRLGQVALGASAIGGVFYLVFALSCSGLAIGSQIIIARRTGEGNQKQAGKVFNQNIYLLGIFGIALFVILRFGSTVFLDHILQSPAVCHQALMFLHYRSFGIFFAATNAVFAAYYIGLSETKVLTYTTFIATIVNIVLDYILIFGKLGNASMGIAGAGLASSIAEASSLIFYVVYTLRKASAREQGLFIFTKWDGSIIRQMLKLAYPTVLQYLISLGSWFLFFVIIEKTGEEKLAISNIIRSTLILFMMAVFGLGTTTNTMVSNVIGQGKDKEIWGLLKKIIVIAFLFILVFLPLILFRPELILRIYTDDSELIRQAINSLLVIYCTMFIFVPGIILISGLSGTGDTRAAMIIEMISILFYLAFAYLMAIVLKMRLEFVWGAETVYWIVVFNLAMLRLRKRKWHKITV